MAKLSREKLKGIVKECLVEILAEGLASDAGMLSETRVRKKRSSAKPAPPIPQRPSLDNIRFGDRVNETVSTLTSDPIMASIFADTATGTLQEQLSAESHGPVALGDSATRAAANADPTDLFGEAANNWAELAFTEKKNR